LVAGHAGGEGRLGTVVEFEFLRDRSHPFTLERLYSMEVLLAAYSGRSEEHARQARELFFSVQNSRKARDGGLAGLLDPPLLARKKAAEKTLRDAVAKDPGLQDAASAWDHAAGAVKVEAEHLRPFTLVEGARGGASGFLSTYFVIARTLVRAAEETPKPNGERLREYRDSNRESLEQNLFSEEPIYDTLEQARLASSLTYLAEQLGYNTPLVQKVLDGKSPAERAAQLIHGTKLK